MPVIIVESNPISTEKKRKLVKEITQIVAETYELPESTITILIRELKREDIGTGGKLLADLDQWTIKTFKNNEKDNKSNDNGGKIYVR